MDGSKQAHGTNSLSNPPNSRAFSVFWYFFQVHVAELQLNLTGKAGIPEG